MPAPVVLPKVTPHIWLFVPRFTAFVLAALVAIDGFVPPVAGNRLVPEGAARLVIVNSDWLAPWPISFCPASRVKPPV